MTSNGAAREAAIRYLERRCVPVPLIGKRPKPNDWEKLRCDGWYDLDAYFPVGRVVNIGLLMGAPSGGLVDADLDCPEARAAAVVLLPNTRMMWGRKSASDSHYGFLVDDPPNKSAEQFNDPLRSGKGARLVELRSTGGQTVVPPSVYPADPEDGHPEVEPCVWSIDDDPTRIGVNELYRCVSRVAAAALIGRYWRRDCRHDSALALAGGLLRGGWSVDDAAGMVEAVCAAAGDEECRDRVRCVRNTADALQAGKTTTGWPRLIELLGKDGQTIAGKVLDWIGVRLKFGSGGTSQAAAESTRREPSERTGYSIILNFFRRHFQPVFRRGTSIYSAALGREVKVGEATYGPSKGLIDELATATNAPKTKNGDVSVNALPQFFNTWSRPAWVDMLGALPDEEVAGEADENAAEEFVQMVRTGLLSMVTLNIPKKDRLGNETFVAERRSMIDWAKRFAKTGGWEEVRSYCCYSRHDERKGGELFLQVAIRHELFAQMHGDRRLIDMPQKTFARRCEAYGVGRSLDSSRPKGRRAILLAPEFVAGLLDRPQGVAEEAEGRKD